MGNALLSIKDTLCGERMGKVFRAIDTDKSGHITREELADWIADERFAGNKYFLGDTLEEQTEKLLKALDTDKDETVSKAELFQYLDQLPEKDLQQLVEETERSASHKRKLVLQTVFDALDVDGNGRVSKDEVLFWLRNERSWRSFGKDAFGSKSGELSERGREKVFKALDRDRDGYVSLEDLHRFFKDWSIKEIRDFSEDQMYYRQLEEYERDPSEKNKAKLLRSKSDLDYAQGTRNTLIAGDDIAK